MIHFLDHQTDEILADMENKEGSALFWNDVHRESIKNEETFDFTMQADAEEAQYASKRNRVVIPDEDGFFREFIIEETFQRTDKSKEVYTSASYIELKKQKVIEPTVLESQTVNSSMDWTLAGTEWQRGITEYAGIRKVTIDKHSDPFQVLKNLASLFGLELRFRVEISGGKITGRFVDMIKRRGQVTNKETEMGKDLIGVERKERSADIVTALLVIGPEQEDGTRLTVTVEDEEALQRWGRNGQHLWGIYEPQTENEEITEERLKQLGEQQLSKVINTIVSYKVTAASIEHIFGYSHEKVRLGDGNRIKDTSFRPALFMDARVIEVARSISVKSKKEFILGDFIEYSEEDIMATFRQLQDLYGTKVIKSASPPTGRKGVIWIKTGGSVEIAHTWDSALNQWVPTGGSITWIKYADDSSGTNMSDNPDGKLYIGIAYNQVDDTPSINPDDYTWSQFVGPQGIQGPSGENGQPTYTWIKYADDSSGTNMSDNPDGKLYIGLAHNKLTQNESLNAGDYTWARIKGDKGEQGPQGLQGLQGPKGDQGLQGPPGEDGASSYTHIAYANSADGETGFSTSDSTNKLYIGMYVDSSPTDSETPSKYKWSLIKGADGEQGLPGPKGDDGLTPYLHIAYATNSSGTSGFSTTDPTNKTYIGTYTDYTAADSTDPSKYTWVKFQGPQGIQGPSGKGVSSIVEQYYLSTSNTTQTGGSWSTTVPTWVDGKYMWTRSVITYTDSTTSTTSPVCVTGAKGSTGSTGATGIGISTVDVEYYLSTSATSLSGGSWSTTAPTWVDGKYMWSRTKTVYSNGTTEYSNAVCITGAKGATGSTGPQGIPGRDGIVNTVRKIRYIRAWSNGSTSNTGNHWVEIQAISGNTNRAKGRPVTASTSASNSERITDGTINTSQYSSVGSGTQWVRIDLGAVYEDIDYIQFWTYWSDARTYHNVKIEISDNGTNWITLFDTTLTGEYKSTSDGVTVLVNPKILTQLTAHQIKSLTGLNVNDQFIVDANGNVTFKGDLDGANGIFNGKITTTGSEGSVVIEDDTITQIKSITDNYGYVTDYSVLLKSGKLLVMETLTDPQKISKIEYSTTIEYGSVNLKGSLSESRLSDNGVRFARYTGGYVFLGIDSSGKGDFYAESSTDNYQFGTQFIDNDGGVARWKHDDSNYIMQNSAILDFWCQGLMALRVQTKDSYNHTVLRNSKVMVKFLNSASTVQIRNAADTAYALINASDFTTPSKREYKKNIEPFDQSALDLVLSTPVYKYHLNEDLDDEFKRTGVILEESPPEIIDLAGEGISVYEMTSVLWKSVQELTAEVDELRNEINVLKGATE